MILTPDYSFNVLRFRQSHKNGAWQRGISDDKQTKNHTSDFRAHALQNYFQKSELETFGLKESHSIVTLFV